MATSMAPPELFVASAEAAAPAGDTSPAASHDRRRVWLWWFLAIIAASQLYFVRELLAALALFAAVFVAIAFVVASLYMLVKCGEWTIARLAYFHQPVLQMPPIPSNSRKPA